MKIGSIGAGNVGGALTKLWREAGHDVRAGGRDSVAEAAAHGDVLLLAVPADAVAGERYPETQMRVLDSEH